MPDYIKIGQMVVEIWQFNDFQNGGCPLCWIFEFQFYNSRGD